MKLYALTMLSSLFYLPVSPTRTQDGSRPPVWTATACPTSINATLPGRNINKTPAGDYKFPDSITIHRALTTCPNIESLNLRYAMLGCTGHPDRWSLPFDISGGEKYPPLKHLSLEDYRFNTKDFERVKPPEGIPGLHTSWYAWVWWIQSGRARQWWEWRKLPEAQRNKTNAELWADAMDWSKVESIELRDISSEPFVTHIVPLLTGLKEITLEKIYTSDRCRCADSGQWLVDLPPLRKLMWFDWNEASLKAFDQILERHGEALETLSIHRRGTKGPGISLSIPQLEKIGRMAPKLKHLAIAVKRNGTWPFETLEAVANISQLDSADLWMEYASEIGYQVADKERELGYGMIVEDDLEYEMASLHYKKPLLNRSGVEEMWNFMRRNPSSKLKKAGFYAGDFTRAWDGPLYSPSRLEQLRVAWLCEEEGCKHGDRRKDVFEEQEDADYGWGTQPGEEDGVRVLGDISSEDGGPIL